MTCDDKPNLVCHKQVESLLLWPNAKTTMHLQEMQFSLAPPKPGCNKLDDVSYYRCAMTKETGFHPVRYRQEKSVTPYHVTQTSRDRYRSTLNVTLVRTDEGVRIQDGDYRRGLEIIN